MKNILALAGLSALLFLSACSKQNDIQPDPTTGLTLVGSGPVAGTRMELYTDGKLVQTGFTRLFVILRDSASGNYIDEAHVHLNPIMHMPMMSHAAPFEEPVSENASNHLFPCNVSFLMPSTAGSWTLDVIVHNHKTDRSGSITLPVTVTDPAKPRLLSFQDRNGVSYFAALVQPAAPRIGVNDMEIALYRKASMMSFLPDSSLNIGIRPEMPSMGHGSPNNVDPVHTGMGHFKGKVNFTMTGAWRVHLNFSAGESPVDSTHYFDIEF